MIFDKQPIKHSELRLRTRLTMALWAVLIAVSFGANLYQSKENTQETLRIQARTTYEKDLLYRRWNADHGGVYVPITEKTQPNPYLEGIRPDRDVLTTSGKRLTLINPAYMNRQVYELMDKEHGLRGHITSLKPIRPENAPDAWEAAALQSFEKGASEVSSIEKIEGRDYIRFMRPFLVEKSCLECHASQGYKEGDVRGGISVSVPIEPSMKVENRFVIVLTVGHAILLLLGLGGIAIVDHRMLAADKKRKEAEERVIAQEKFLESILESLTHPFYVVDINDYSIIVANSAAVGQGIVDHKACYAVTHRRDKPCADEHVCPIEIVKRTKKAATVEHVHYNQDGTQRDVEVHAYPIFNKDGEVVQMIEYSLDITQRKQVERKEREAIAVKSKFVSMVTHELRNPLAIIKGSIDMVSDGTVGPINQEQKGFLETALKDVNRLSRLTSDILDIQKIEAGKMKLDLQGGDINKLIVEIYNKMKMVVEGKGLKLVSQLDEKLPETMLDKDRIEQVLINLINNAIKFTEQGQIKISTKQIKDAIEVSVQDSGEGIKEADLHKIFDKFEQSGKERKGGTGLGLSIAREIIKEHKGKIWVESELGKGSIFRFVLPI